MNQFITLEDNLQLWGTFLTTYSDPPPHGCGGEHTSAYTIEIVQFWERNLDDQNPNEAWIRRVDLEGPTIDHDDLERRRSCLLKRMNDEQKCRFHDTGGNREDLAKLFTELEYKDPLGLAGRLIASINYEKLEYQARKKAESYLL